MKKITTLLLVLLGINVLGQKIPSPNTQLYVTDLANVLSDNDEKKIDNLIRTYKSKTTTEFAVLTVSSLDGYDIESYSNKVFNKWGIGQISLNNGLLIVVAIQEHKLRVEVGGGLEPYLTDSYTKEKSGELATPKFKQGDFATGIYNLINDFQTKLGYTDFSTMLIIQSKVEAKQKEIEAKRKQVEAKQKKAREEKEAKEELESRQQLYNNLLIVGIFLIFASIIGFIVYIIYRYKKAKEYRLSISNKITDTIVKELSQIATELFSYKADISQDNLPTYLNSVVDLTKSNLKKMKFDDLEKFNTEVDIKLNILNSEIQRVSTNKSTFERAVDTLSKLTIPSKLLSSVDQLLSVNYDIEANKANRSLNDLKEFEKMLQTSTPKSIKQANNLLNEYEKLVAKVKTDISNCEINKVTWNKVLQKTKLWPANKDTFTSKLDEFQSTYKSVQDKWGEFTKGRLVDIKKSEFNTFITDISKIVDSIDIKKPLKQIMSLEFEYDSLVKTLSSRLSNPKMVDLDLTKELNSMNNMLSNLKDKCKEANKMSGHSDVTSSSRKNSLNYISSLSSVIGLSGLAVLAYRELIEKSQNGLDSHIRKMRSDISEAEDERRRKREEEERERRRKREEEEAEERRRRDSYNSSSSWSSSSSDWGSSSSSSSYGGGSSFGGGSTSDW